MEGFFAAPIYGGNADMAGWKLIGFPGTRYDYRDVIERPNQRYTLPPVSLAGRPDESFLVLDEVFHLEDQLERLT